MKRIIIEEIDNTFNVEPLSSYDVVYVPGFVSEGVATKEYFRTPTLVTSKYQFMSLFGSSNGTQGPTISDYRPPTFPYDQPYPVATTTTEGFPTYAIPNYTEVIVSETPEQLTNFTDEDTFSTYYTKAEIPAEPVDPGVDWTPEEGIYYYLRTPSQTGEGWQMEYTTFPLSTGETIIEVYGPNGSDNVYYSIWNPRAHEMYEGGENTGKYLTPDSQITPVSDGSGYKIKDYYQATQSTPPMFYSGDADPGWRYAFYLLSLGIPVYFEQMNSGEYTEINMITDWDTALITYGTGEGSDRHISPYDNGWYYLDGVTYIKCNDPSIGYYTLDDAEEAGIAWYEGADISLNSMYTGLKKRFMAEEPGPDYSFDSMGDYSVKYITSGGYPTFEYGLKASTTSEESSSVYSGLAESMIELCEKRGDAIALIDHTDNPDRTIYEPDTLSVIYQAKIIFGDMNEETSSHGAMFTPWYFCTHGAITNGANGSNNTTVPASLAFLSALAVQLRNYNPWLAVSGVTRGKVPYFGSLHTNYLLTNNVADSYQTVPSAIAGEDTALVSINPITNIRQYGHCIWGNRTLRNNKSGTKATSFLNIRNLTSDIKKRLFEASQQLLFDQNTDLLWINFKALVSPLLDTMVSNNILSDYKMTKYNIDPETGEQVPAYMVLANIRINPINSVEVFDLTVRLENNEIAVAETE